MVGFHGLPVGMFRVRLFMRALVRWNGGRGFRMWWVCLSLLGMRGRTLLSRWVGVGRIFSFPR